QLTGLQRVADRRQARLVVEEEADGDVALAVLGESRPVMGYGGVEVEQAAGDEDVGAEGDGPLGAGPDEGEGVALPRASVLAVGETAPEVHDWFAVERDADGGADLVAVTEVALEFVADGREARVAV